MGTDHTSCCLGVQHLVRLISEQKDSLAVRHQGELSQGRFQVGNLLAQEVQALADALEAQAQAAKPRQHHKLHRSRKE